MTGDGKRWNEQELTDLMALSQVEFLCKYPGRTEDARLARRKRFRLEQKYPRKPVEEGQAEVQAEGQLGRLEQELLKLLQSGTLTMEELAMKVDRHPRTVETALEKLRESGYEVHVDERAGTALLVRQVRATDMVVDLTQYYQEQLRFGVISCTHIGSLYRQLAPLRAFYELCVKEKVSVVIHAGDIVDGTGMYRGQEYEQYAHGADEQEAAAVEEYPRSEIPTKVIGGNHDYSFIKRAGYNIVRKVCEMVPGLDYCGLLAATFTIGDRVKVLSLHRSGGVPYARSYRGQKANEALGRGDQVPEIFVIGGLHVVDYVPYLGVQTFLAGAFQGQTPYLKEKALWPDIGGWIVTVNLADDGRINRCLLEWISFEEVHEFGK